MELHGHNTLSLMGWMAVFLVVCTQITYCIPTDSRLSDTDWEETENDVKSITPWNGKFKLDLLRDLAKLAEDEERIATKLHDLSSQRDKIREQKRGHVQCFLNLVSCYRKRK